MEAPKIEIGQIWKWGKGIAWESPDQYIVITGYDKGYEVFTAEMLSSKDPEELIYSQEDLLTKFERVS